MEALYIGHVGDNLRELRGVGRYANAPRLDDTVRPRLFGVSVL